MVILLFYLVFISGRFRFPRFTILDHRTDMIKCKAPHHRIITIILKARPWTLCLLSYVNHNCRNLSRQSNDNVIDNIQLLCSGAWLASPVVRFYAPNLHLKKMLIRLLWNISRAHAEIIRWWTDETIFQFSENQPFYVNMQLDIAQSFNMGIVMFSPTGLGVEILIFPRMG